jgi:hypothetical protein
MDFSGSAEASEELRDTLMGGLQYHYVNDDGHPFNDDYERLQAYRDLFEAKSDYSYLQDLTGIIIAGLEASDGSPTINKMSDPYINGLETFINFRRATMAADISDNTARTTCGAVRKAGGHYLQEWNKLTACASGADELRDTYMGGLEYHYIKVDHHPYISDYERLQGYSDLYVKRNLWAYIAQFARDLTRVMIALDAMKVMQSCTCGHAKDGIANWLRVWDDQTASSEAGQIMLKNLQESLAYHVERQDGHPFNDDYRRLIAASEYFTQEQIMPVTDQAKMAEDLLNYQRGLLAVDSWSVAQVCGCGSIRKGVETWLNSWLDSQKSEHGAEFLTDYVRGAVRYHYVQRDNHLFTGHYERLQRFNAVYEKNPGPIPRNS